MPFLNFKFQISNFKLALYASCFIILASVLSGCSAIGADKPAALQVISTPEASIFLDGKHLGKTPFRSDQLKNKTYTVKLSSGQASYVEKVSLTSGTLTVVERELNDNFLAQSGHTLSLLHGQKGLFLSSMPYGASVTLDGTAKGQTPYLNQDISDGDHKISLSHEGYIQKDFVIKTSKDFQVTADVTLASKIAKGVTPSQSSLPPVVKVEILSTPGGFLRVRKEPSLTAIEVGRVKPGNQLELIQETKDWVQIKFEGKQGWVSSIYTKKL